ncbi:MAG: type II toxin-antitoxin system PemK/MazF family toxin [Sphingomonadaceae bacterium]|nr:type II toxin-antitoxin system PemK/MazF family toxin [Sphingomonadaceae bacterium]
MKRGQVVIAAPGEPFGRKPRPYVVVQSDAYQTALVLLVGFTTAEDSEPNIVRPRFAPTSTNGLLETSDAMVDAVIAVRRSKARDIVGVLSDDEMYEIEAALVRLLGLAEGA